jgi:hypothetical protein
VNSSREGSKERQVMVEGRAAGEAIPPALMMISLMPNSPIAITPIPIPSSRVVSPNVKRAAPEVTSIPTKPINIPRMTEMKDLMGEPCVSTAAPVMPSTTSAKYSGDWNVSATEASGGAKSASTTIPTELPHSEAMVVMKRATPARPF